MSAQKLAPVPLPETWNRQAGGSVLQSISIAPFATACTRGEAANSVNTRIRLQAERDRADPGITFPTTHRCQEKI